MQLITLTHPMSAAAEAYRTLRTNLYFAALEQPFKTLVVAAPSQSEHKTSAVANLAVVMAQAGQTVIAVDADFRSPMLHSLFGVSNDSGLSTALEAESSPIPLQPTAVPRLHVLASGPAPAIPSDVLNSKRMSALIDALKERADVVLIEVPATTVASDAGILASKADAALLVITAGETRREHALAAKELLLRARARVLGAVMLNEK